MTDTNANLKTAVRGVLLATAAGFAFSAHADEGMWMPSQLPQIADQLAAAGYKGDPAALADLTRPPMSNCRRFPPPCRRPDWSCPLNNWPT